jgi:hypothetical protein
LITGSAGGLAIQWNPTTNILDNFFTTKWTILANYKDLGSSKEGIITNVYGPNLHPKKISFLENLEGVQAFTQNKHWILGGDFNIIHSLEEKRGGNYQLESDSEGFKDLIDNLHLVDMECINGDFSWSNHKLSSNHVSCRLDWFLV